MNTFSSQPVFSSNHIGKICCCIAIATLLASCSSTQSSGQYDNEITKVGKAAYRNSPLSRDTKVPQAMYRSEHMLTQAAPTNQWYSSVMFTRWSEVLHALPLTFKAGKDGFEVGLPKKQIVATQRKDVEVFFPHFPDLVFAPLAFEPQVAYLAGYGDWHAVVSLQEGKNNLSATVAHGSPFAYFTVTTGNISLKLDKALTAQIYPENSTVLLVSGKQKTYAVFAPSAGNWKKTATTSQGASVPTYGTKSTLTIYDGRLAENLYWESYNPDGLIQVTDSDDESVFFEDREDKESKYLKISKKGENGNVFTVFQSADSQQKADLSFWQESGVLVFDIRVNSAEEGVGFLVKIDSGWPNVSDYDVPLPEQGTWKTIRIPVRDLLASGNRLSPGGFANIRNVKNFIVFEPTGVMEVDIDNVRYEIAENNVANQSIHWQLQLPAGKQYFSVAALPDAQAQTVETFINSAYSHITETRADWQYDRKTSQVTTTFTAQYQNMESDDLPPPPLQ